MSVDIGDNCVECGQDTAAGSGRFVNRIPADNGESSGYMCAECQAIECEICGEPTIEWETHDELGSLCPDCFEKAEGTPAAESE